jgi:hypothetical protein
LVGTAEAGCPRMLDARDVVKRAQAGLTETAAGRFEVGTVAEGESPHPDTHPATKTTVKALRVRRITRAESHTIAVNAGVLRHLSPNKRSMSTSSDVQHLAHWLVSVNVVDTR